MVRQRFSINRLFGHRSIPKAVGPNADPVLMKTIDSVLAGRPVAIFDQILIMRDNGVHLAEEASRLWCWNREADALVLLGVPREKILQLLKRKPLTIHDFWKALDLGAKPNEIKSMARDRIVSNFLSQAASLFHSNKFLEGEKQLQRARTLRAKEAFCRNWLQTSPETFYKIFDSEFDRTGDPKKAWDKVIEAVEKHIPFAKGFLDSRITQTKRLHR